MNVYFDSSAVFKLLVYERGSEVAVAVWEEATERVASRLVEVEVISALARAHRGGRIQGHDHVLARSGASSVIEELDLVEIDEPVIGTAVELSGELALRAYDAVHLSAALQVQDAVLATWDSALVRAARRLGMPVATSSR